MSDPEAITNIGRSVSLSGEFSQDSDAFLNFESCDGTSPNAVSSTSIGHASAHSAKVRAKRSSVVRPEERMAFREAWKQAKLSAAALLIAAERNENIDKDVAARDVESAVDELWSFRATRDIDWRTIANHVRSMFRQVECAEELTVEQCQGIRTMIDEHLGTSTKSVHDLREVVRLIKSIGFDPYGDISADPKNI